MTFAGSLVVLGALGRMLGGTPPGEALERLATDAELAAVAIECLLGDADLPGGWCRGWASARRW